MAKQRKQERVTEREEIKALWEFMRSLSVRVDALQAAIDGIEDELNDGVATTTVESHALPDDWLDELVAEAMAARPWYAKVGGWLRQGDNGLVVASIGVATALVVGLIALFVR
jgi:hypothetical protein